jgi:hypothetical protein
LQSAIFLIDWLQSRRSDKIFIAYLVVSASPKG